MNLKSCTVFIAELKLLISQPLEACSHRLKLTRTARSTTKPVFSFVTLPFASSLRLFAATSDTCRLRRLMRLGGVQPLLPEDFVDVSMSFVPFDIATQPRG